MKRVSGFLFAFLLCVIAAGMGCSGSNSGGNSPVSSSSKTMVAFSIVSPVIASGTVDETAKTVTITVSYNTALDALVAEFSTSGVKTLVGTEEQISGSTKNNFTVSVVYTVVAEDGSTQDYKVTVSKIEPSHDAALSDIVVSKGVLQPVFSSATTDYLDAPVPFSSESKPSYNDKQSAGIKVTAVNENAVIKINETAVKSGELFMVSDLAVGANSVTIVVTAEDGKTISTYKVIVYRAIPIFKTGAVAISGSSVDVREDASVQRGVSWPSPRFSDNGDGTMTDNLTGLVWLQSVSSTAYSWTDAYSYCSGLTTAGGGWRVPNIREIRSLFNYGTSPQYQWMGDQGFGDAVIWWYWSSTTSAYDTTCAWDASMVSAGTASYSGKTYSEYIWPVRSRTNVLPVSGQKTSYAAGDDGESQSGVKFPSLRFRNNGDGTMTDNMTGLVWLQNADCANGLVTWSDALTYVDGLNNGTNTGNCGYADWRLPNLNELESLMEYGQSAPKVSLANSGFAKCQQKYWSSTGQSSSEQFAWCENLVSGISAYMKTETLYVWPVRGN